MYRQRLVAVVLAAVVLAPQAVNAVQRTAVFGDGGVVYKVRSGAYGELFPGSALPAATPVLVLDVGRPDQPRLARMLVPGSEPSGVDREPSLFYEDASRLLYVLWVEDAGGVAQINLVTYGEAGWSPVIEVTGPPAPLKGRPQLVVSRSSLVGTDGVARTVAVLHLLWWEQTQGAEVAYYSPLVLEDGVYVGWNPVFRLNDFDRSPSQPPGGSWPLFQAPALDAGRDSMSAVLGVANPRSDRLVVFEVVVLPLALTRLGDSVASLLREQGIDDPTTLAGDMRAHIIYHGSLGHPSLAAYLADQVAARILAAGATGTAEQLAAEVRTLLLGEGATALLANRLGPAGASDLRLIEMPASVGAGLPNNLIAMRRVGVRELPDIEGDEVTLQLSPDGEEALITWRRDGQLYYRETQGSGWTDALRPNMPRNLGEDPERLLADRLFQH